MPSHFTFKLLSGMKAHKDSQYMVVTFKVGRNNKSLEVFLLSYKIDDTPLNMTNGLV